MPKITPKHVVIIILVRVDVASEDDVAEMRAMQLLMERSRAAIQSAIRLRFDDVVVVVVVDDDDDDDVCIFVVDDGCDVVVDDDVDVVLVTHQTLC